MANHGKRILALLACGLWVGTLCAQNPADNLDEPSLVNEKRFGFDFTIDPLVRSQLQEVQLHVSTDRGASWRLYRGVAPEKGTIPFEGAGDGEYWFAVQKVFKDGRKDPARMEGAAPDRRVVVDTTPPRLQVRAVQSAGQVGVEWSILSNDADLSSFSVETRGPGGNSWTPIAVKPSWEGQKLWTPEGRGPSEVRVKVSDRAGNAATQTATIAATRGGGFAAAPRSEASDGEEFRTPPRPSASRSEERSAPGRLVSPNSLPAVGRGADSPRENQGPSLNSPPIFYVNRKRFHVNYRLSGVGKSGVKSVTLYWRHPDEREWQPCEDPAHADGSKPPAPPYHVDVEGEGKFCICLRVVSGVGIGEEPPDQATPPQLIVVVDLTPPTIHLDVPQVRHGEQPEVAFAWTVTDENPGVKKVRLSYAAEATASQWREIAHGLPNEGVHRWKPPPDAPYRFHVRIEAEDAAGNTAQMQTVEAVVVDNARPQAIPLSAEVTGGDEQSPSKGTGALPPKVKATPKSVSADDPSDLDSPPEKKAVKAPGIRPKND